MYLYACNVRTVHTRFVHISKSIFNADMDITCNRTYISRVVNTKITIIFMLLFLFWYFFFLVRKHRVSTLCEFVTNIAHIVWLRLIISLLEKKCTSYGVCVSLSLTLQIFAVMYLAFESQPCVSMQPYVSQSNTHVQRSPKTRTQSK